MQRSRGAAGIRWRLVEDREHGLFRRHVGCSSALLCELDAFVVRARGFLVTGFWKSLPEGRLAVCNVSPSEGVAFSSDFSGGSFTHFVRCCFRPRCVPWCVLLSEGNLCKCHLVARVAQPHSCNNQGSFVATARLRDDPTSRGREGRPGRAVDGSRLIALWSKKKPNGVTSQDLSGLERSPAQEEGDRQDVHRGKVTLLPIGGSEARKIS